MTKLGNALWQFYITTALPDSRIMGVVEDTMIHWFPNMAKRVFPSLNEDFSIVKWDKSTTTLVNHDYTLRLKNSYMRILLREFREWERAYLMDVRGKTVLDVGAGCGETCLLWFKNGAKRVIAIEPDKDCCRLLGKNAYSNRWDVVIKNDYFRPRYLDLPHDVLKIDAEGGEVMLLNEGVNSIKPCRMELHPRVIGQANFLAIVKKFNLHKVEGSYVWGA